MPKVANIVRLCMAGALVLALWGCTTASMRVEVQVYKGPLSRELPAQVGELAGFLDGSQKYFEGFAKEAESLLVRHECDYKQNSNSVSCQIIKTFCEGREISEEMRKLSICLNKIDLTNQDQKKGLKKVLQDISALSMRLKTRALNDVYYQNAWLPESLQLRILATNYINLAAETSNQLGARADALLKQIDGGKAETLAQSVYLRDSAPTSLLNAYVWDRAMAVPLGGDFGTNDQDDRQDRVRALETHFADQYWSTINTVVAVGQGEVGMALVKDDIGNWNLKNFSNDPSEQIQAYKNVGLAALHTAAELVEQGTTGLLNDAQRFLTVAEVFNFGGRPAQGSEMASLLNDLRTSTQASLQRVVDQTRTRRNDLDLSLSEPNRAFAAADPTLPNQAPANCQEDKVDMLTPRKQALDLMHDLRMASSDMAKSAVQAAQCALKQLDGTADQACQVGSQQPKCLALARAQAWLDKAEARRRVYAAQQERDGLARNAAAQLRDILDEYDRTLAALSRLGQPAASQ